ncbi:hypothetical protein PRK78_002294 [Emydomyces testavorans]|uniref:Phosphatidate phosphatase APP1 catalytic domain-containing protein n=1 Tax=Emydomyces testavorans TaxID=2070801 RepID=A0AAF0DES9_9EURO|nr:hypothetical protein PRK78_002294 [Emydomyces testavorans]
MESKGESYRWGVDGTDEGRERGSKRSKVYNYLRAANELRQTYSAQWTQKAQGALGAARDVSNDFADLQTVRSGDEEMVLFPSYGRRHVGNDNQGGKGNDHGWPGSLDEEDTGRPQSQGMEYWESIWHRYESDNAVVDIDVRGWIYSPNKGPMTRKNRLLIALARKISGIPAPSPSVSGDGRSSGQDDISLEKQAESIAGKQTDIDNQRQSSLLSRDEISAANAQLMDRLRPFLTSPAVGMPATIFFFNDTKSQSRTVLTNDGGHFAVRASLDFVPSHIRVLASETLSAMEEIKIIEPSGVSLISDIDDTIKHSAIMSGAKEIFRNTFVRDFTDLSVLGVREWYSQMANMGVGIHYVSNSPWQLYPLLKSYFSQTGLPPGSFHLKQYSGMLQGIFEPTAERKRPTLERIIQDFPDRHFILVGDSGEADLEIYTDLVVANPGRILGVFIRDVTTPAPNQFFDKSISHLEKPKPLPRSMSWNTFEDTSDSVDKRPPLPPRTFQQESPGITDDSIIKDLIDLETEEKDKNNLPISSRKPPNVKSGPPTPPSKPSKLRGESVETSSSQESDFLTVVRRKPIPPPPAKPRGLSISKNVLSEQKTEGPSSENAATSNPGVSIHPRTKEPPPVPPPRRSGLNNLPKSQSTPPNPPPQLNDTLYFRTPTSASEPPLNRPSASSLSTTIPTSRISTPSLSSSEIPAQSPNKREEAWRRRWVRAKEIFDRRGVVLQSWRVGNDVQERCVRLVRQAQSNIAQGDVNIRS